MVRRQRYARLRRWRSAHQPLLRDHANRAQIRTIDIHALPATVVGIEGVDQVAWILKARLLGGNAAAEQEDKRNDGHGVQAAFQHITLQDFTRPAAPVSMGYAPQT